MHIRGVSFTKRVYSGDMTKAEFARRVREAMEVKQFSQGQLAIRSGLRQNHISLITLGQREPGVLHAAALARALGVTLDWLCGLPDNTGATLTPDEDEVLRIYRTAKAQGNGAMALHLIQAMEIRK